MAIHTVDVKGLSCPMPIIRAKKALEEVPVGDILEVLATDPGSKADFPAWAKNAGQELVSADEINSVYVYRVRKVK